MNEQEWTGGRYTPLQDWDKKFTIYETEYSGMRTPPDYKPKDDTPTNKDFENMMTIINDLVEQVHALKKEVTALKKANRREITKRVLTRK